MRIASHVMYHGIAALRAALPRSITLAKGEAPPLPFDPSPAFAKRLRRGRPCLPSIEAHP